jgi:hypothetical protein
MYVADGTVHCQWAWPGVARPGLAWHGVAWSGVAWPSDRQLSSITSTISHIHTVCLLMMGC